MLGAPARVLDIGGLPGQLNRYLPHSKVLAANVMEPTDVLIPEDHLPFTDGSFTATTSLDVLEHVPPANRASFIAEMLRVTEQRSVLCCPLGSPEHDALEREIDAWYRELTGDGHPWLREHLQYGLPTLDSIRELYAEAGATVRFAFHGDTRETSTQFRTVVLARKRLRPADLARFAAFRLPYRPQTALLEAPTPWTNRVFAIVDR
ncbi:MAG TPA: methyltransferase domain-containing protein [Gaiellales bacterium]